MGARTEMGEFATIEAGGRRARMYVAGNQAPGTQGILLLHAWWGLNDDVIGYADRLAEAGFAVVAPDMFDGKVASTIEEADQLSGSSDDKAIQAIVLAAADDLADGLRRGAAVAAVGFSFGAAWALWAPTRSDRIGSTVVYYGTWNEAEVLSGSRVPVLGHFAESDPYETAEAVDEFENLLEDAGRNTEIHRYPGTGHWFAEPSRDAYRGAAADLAFQRTVAFLNRLAAPAED